MIPASNQKLLVAAAALEVLGADHVFTTEVRAGPVSGGVVAGDLYLVGGGDPVLTTDDYPAAEINGYPVLNATSLDVLADSVAAAGITRIDGNVVGDGSRFDDELFHPNWPDDVLVTEAGPFDALLVNDARFADAAVPSIENWQVANDPSAGAAEELARLLEARGITIAGAATSGTAPADLTVVASIDSAPLPAVIDEMQASSDNNTAEMLLKELGVASGGEGTTAAGAAAVTTALGNLGLDTTGVVVDDGSGLSNENRVTCRLLAGILAAHEPGDEFAAGLPAAGQEGTTLSDVFVGSAVEDRLVGKTGTLHNEPYNADPPAVKALSGYLPIEGGGTIEFALVLNSTGTLTEQTRLPPDLGPLRRGPGLVSGRGDGGRARSRIGRRPMRTPMFPLGNTLLPGELLPLNVFEPRYRQLVLDCLAAEVAEFGVVLIERGSEVGGGDARTSVGTIARIVRVLPLGGGRFDVAAVGTGASTCWSGSPTIPTRAPTSRTGRSRWRPTPSRCAGSSSACGERVEAARALVSEVARANKRRPPFPKRAPVELSDDVVRATYQLAARAPIGPADRHRLLAAPTLDSRLEALGAALDDAEAMLRFRLA